MTREKFLHDDVAHLVRDFIHGEFTICPDDLDQEPRRVFDPNRIGAKRANAGGSEFGVAQHDGVFRAPFQVVETGGVDEVDFGFERAFEAVIPVLQGCHDWHVVGFEHVKPGREHICQLPLVHKHRRLTFANRQLGAVFDLVAFTFEPHDHCVAGVIHPMDHIDELAGEKVENTHGLVLL